MSSREPAYWTIDKHEDRLYCTTIQEAIEGFVDMLSCCDEDIPAEITVYGFAHMEIDKARIANNVIDYVLEILDEEYGDPDGSYTTPVSSQREAAMAFVDAVLKDYSTWACEKVCEETVKVSDYCEPQQDAEGGENM